MIDKDDTLVDGGDGQDVVVIEDDRGMVFDLGAANVEMALGSAGTDVLSAGVTVSAAIYGRAGADTLIGGAGADYLDGGADDDTLDGGAGADTLRGGDGDDTFLVGEGDTVIEAVGEGRDRVQTVLAGYTLTANVENLQFVGDGDFAGIGNDGDNLITGGTGNDFLTGLGGDDTLDGGVGVDTLAGGTGDDTYMVDSASDVVIEAVGEGEDTIVTTLNTFTLGGQVEDLIFTGQGAFIGTGTDAANVIIGGASGDTLDGGLGDDTLDGGQGADTLTGGVGNDTYVVDQVDDVLVESAEEDGEDTIVTSLASYQLGNAFENLAHDGSTNFTGLGNAKDNTLVGGSGDDVLDGGTGADVMVGGAGNDLYRVDDVGDWVVEDANGGIDMVETSLQAFGLADQIENVKFTGTGTFVGVGNALDNWLVGGTGADTLDGGAGDDTLDGDAGADILIGGTGNDLYLVDDSGDQLVEQADGGIDTVQTSAATYTLGEEIENLRFVGSGAFIGTGNDSDNVITGGAVTDTLYGGAGADILDGGLGADTLAGGSGDDVYHVDHVGDILVEIADGGHDTVITSLAAYTLAAEVEDIVYQGLDAFSGIGNASANTMVGGAGNDFLNGGGGNDFLDGGAGADTMSGGAGDDIFVVDDAGDVVVETVGQGFDTVRALTTSYTLGAGIEMLVHEGAGDFVGTGNAETNTLLGGAGNDTLDGGAGADRMVGGVGDDVYMVDNADDVVVEEYGGGRDSVRTSLQSYILGDEVENLIYVGSSSFSGTGNARANLIQGGAGADVLDGRGGNDTMIGGSGNDVYYVDSVGDCISENAGGGYDTVYASTATFTLGADFEALVHLGADPFVGTGNALDNHMVGGTGVDTLYGGQGADQLDGGDGGDTLDGGDGDDRLYGGAGDDLLDGGLGSDTMMGGAGDDVYLVNAPGDVIIESAGEGRDLVRTSITNYTLLANFEALQYIGYLNFTGYGNSSDNWIFGSYGNDTLIGNGGADELLGGAGDDTLVVDTVDTVIDGGTGSDTVLIGDNSGVVFNLDRAINVETLVGGQGSDVLSLGSINKADLYGGNGNDILYGSSSNDRIWGDGGNDTLIGGAGDDILTGGGGSDTFSVGTNSGSDLIYADSSDVVMWTVNGHVGDVAISACQNDLILVDNSSGERATIVNYFDGTANRPTIQFREQDGSVHTAVISDYSDLINHLNLVLTAPNGTGYYLFGASTLIGGGGNDVLSGGYRTGYRDDLFGWWGYAASVDGGAGNDTLTFGDSGGGVSVDLSTGSGSIAGSGPDGSSWSMPQSVSNVENVVGTAFRDTLKGDGGDNTLVGGGGGDVLVGGGGNDALEGGENGGYAEALEGGDGIDSAVYSHSGQGVVVDLGSGRGYGGEAERDFLSNIENVVGSDFADILRGNAQANMLTGGDGDDTLEGGAGDDT
ncbi:calcium-binding protein, partial [Magnetospirillum aberrantis]|nr:RTX toxin [Magnetospirillum aberrantis SpK]